MDPDTLSLLAPVVVLVFVTLTVAGVILLKPLSSRLAMLLEVMAREKSEPRPLEEIRHVRELLETLDGRVSLLEERQDFTDALLSEPERRKLRPSGRPDEPPEATRG
jgi:hypothetical protein